MFSFRWSLVAFVLLLASACAGIVAMKEPSVRLADIEMLDSTLFEQRMLLKLRVGNPNDTELALDGLTFTLEVNGERLSEGYSNSSVTIPRLSEATVSVLATTTIFDMVRQAMALGNAETITYRMSGDVYLRGFTRRTVAYDKKGTLRLMPKSGGGHFLTPGN